MRTTIKILIWFSIIFFSANIFAEKNSAAATQLIDLLNNIKNLQANFTQIIYDNNGRVLQQTNGQMSLQRPGKFRWETNKPTKQLLIADGTQVWFYDYELAQVTVQKQQTMSGNSPAMLLSGTATTLAKDYQIKPIQTADTAELAFKLAPKGKNNFFQSVELYFKQDTLEKMQLIDNLNQMTVVSFSGVQSNIDLNPQVFYFHVPKNVDVVKQ